MRAPKEFGLPPFAHSFTVPTVQMDEDFLRWIQQNCVISTEAEWLKRDAELDRLRRELAEARKLLRELWSCECYGWPDDFPARIDAAISSTPAPQEVPK